MTCAEVVDPADFKWMRLGRRPGDARRFAFRFSFAAQTGFAMPFPRNREPPTTRVEPYGPPFV